MEYSCRWPVTTACRQNWKVKAMVKKKKKHLSRSLYFGAVGLLIGRGLFAASPRFEADSARHWAQQSRAVPVVSAQTCNAGCFQREVRIHSGMLSGCRLALNAESWTHCARPWLLVCLRRPSTFNIQHWTSNPPKTTRGYDVTGILR